MKIKLNEIIRDCDENNQFFIIHESVLLFID